jgi:hypothetical protein
LGLKLFLLICWILCGQGRDVAVVPRLPVVGCSWLRSQRSRRMCPLSHCVKL